MSKIDPLAKMLGEGVVEMRRRLDAAEGRAEELQRQLNLAHEALRTAREALSIGIQHMEEGLWDPNEAIAEVSAALREIAEVLP